MGLGIKQAENQFVGLQNIKAIAIAKAGKNIVTFLQIVVVCIFKCVKAFSKFQYSVRFAEE